MIAPAMIPIQEIQRYCDEIAAAFKPEKIILFGSHAYGKPHLDSDVDVLVVMPESRRAGYQAVIKIRERVRARFPVDLLVRGSRDIERRVKDGESFILDITEKGRVMYEAGHPGNPQGSPICARAVIDSTWP